MMTQEQKCDVGLLLKKPATQTDMFHFYFLFFLF